MSLKKYILPTVICTMLAGCHENASDVVEYVSPGGGGTSAPYLSYQESNIYVNGVNTAWLNYAQDFGTGLDESRAIQLFDQVRSVGGNSVRWWVHTNGTVSPVWSADKNSVASGAEQALVIADMKTALDLAAERDMYVIFNLWSFDMLAIKQDGVTEVVDANFKLLSEPGMQQSYIDNFIFPLLEEVAGHPALLAIDLFNEPENMTESWFREREGLGSTYNVSIDQIHQTTAVLSAAIHNKSDELGKQVLVTTGPKSLGMFNTDGFGGDNYYSDEKMEALAGKNAGLDFYAPHYYDDMGKEGAWSPFYHKASYWELDKPIVIGEFFADADAYKPADFNYFGDPLSEAELCVRLGENEYAGGLSWQWTNQYSQSTLDCVAAKAGVEIGPVSGIYDFDDGIVPTGFATKSETSEKPIMSISESESNSSDKSLMIKVNEEHTGEKKAYVQFPVSGFDFDVVGTVTLKVKLSADLSAAGFSGGKLYIKDGNWVWSEGPWVNMSAEDWTEVKWVMETPPTSLNELGLQLYAGDGSQETSAVAYIDDLMIQP
ncbi:Mannan endo-14-beta-mannosidase precursor (Beta-mannanase) (Endo-beta-14-mannanase) (ManA) [Vibrio cyclitrophicus]|nr:Mannan endo-14-beta-mannosidase precursor (Beta-mannanase) (Endo-beta-14-mannanase) (ManA) [Vibrio cyclitrophicus]